MHCVECRVHPPIKASLITSPLSFQLQNRNIARDSYYSATGKSSSFPENPQRYLPTVSQKVKDWQELQTNPSSPNVSKKLFKPSLLVLSMLFFHNSQLPLFKQLQHSELWLTLNCSPFIASLLLAQTEVIGLGISQTTAFLSMSHIGRRAGPH